MVRTTICGQIACFIGFQEQEIRDLSDRQGIANSKNRGRARCRVRCRTRCDFDTLISNKNAPPRTLSIKLVPAIFSYVRRRQNYPSRTKRKLPSRRSQTPKIRNLKSGFWCLGVCFCKNVDLHVVRTTFLAKTACFTGSKSTKARIQVIENTPRTARNGGLRDT